MSYHDAVSEIVNGSWVRIWNHGNATAKELLVAGGQLEGRTTGIYHVGAKQYVAAAMLLGVDVVIAGTDSKGRFILTFDIQEDPNENVGSELFANIHRQGGSERLNLMRTAHFGYSLTRPVGTDDNQYYKPISQAVINAAEAAEQFGQPGEWGIDEESDLPGTSETAVYFTSTDGTRSMIQYFDYYFKTRNTNVPRFFPVEPTRIGQVLLNGHTLAIEIWPTSTDDSEFTIYGWAGDRDLGVAYLIYAKQAKLNDSFGRDKRTSGIGDIVVVSRGDDLLDGDRELRDIDALLNQYGQVWANSDNKDSLIMFLKAARIVYNLEAWVGGPYSHRHPSVLKAAFYEAFGEKAFVWGYGDTKKRVIEAEEHGYVGIELYSSDVLNWLKQAGVRTADMASGYDNNGRKTRELTAREEKIVDKALAVIKHAPGLLFPDAYYRVITELAADSADKSDADLRTGCISIWHELLSAGLTQQLIETLLHEHRHLIYQVHYHGTEFSGYADTQLARIVIDLAKV